MDADAEIGWTSEDSAKVSAYLALRPRTRYADDPAQFAAEHQREGCRVWKAGIGSVVPGFVVSPALVLSDREG
jgi:hypothetical protein